MRSAAGRLQGERQLNNEGGADLWDEFVTELRLKATPQLNFVWIKGHATQIHTDRETTTTLDTWETMLQTHWRLPLRHITQLRRH